MDWILFDPKGPVGAKELHIIATAAWLMLIVVVPVIVLTLVFAWRYRASSQTARYTPEWDRSVPIALVCVTIPIAIVATLGVIAWRESHELDPYRPLDGGANGELAKPMEVQVVALDWKWLFVYPQLGVATVNELAFPAGTPVHFSITATSVMNAFFIPQLGSMVYAMPRMQTQLSLLADTEGTYAGLSANYSGAGFSDMKFAARALSRTAFAEWVDSVRRSDTRLDAVALGGLLKPEVGAVAHYSAVDGDVFGQLLMAEAQRPGTSLASAAQVCTTRGN